MRVTESRLGSEELQDERPPLSTSSEPNIVSAEFKRDPFTFLARLRKSEPVYRTTLPDKTPVWLVTRLCGPYGAPER